MEWAIGTRRRAIAAAASVAFYAAAAGHAQAQQSAAGDSQQATQQTSATQQDATPANTLPSISVKGAAESEAPVGLVARRSSTGTKTDTALNEIPQTINVVTAQQVEETGATSVNEALRYVPGFSTYGADVRSDWYSVLRGFTPTVFVDGLQVPNTLNLSSWRVDPYMIDSITVLRGPTSVLYGQGDPGAIVDVQSKLANGERIREIEMQLGDYARKQLAFDVGDKIDKDGTLSYRFVGVGRDGNSQTGPNPEQRVAIAPSVKWQPNAKTSLTVEATYLQDWGDASNNFLPAQGTILPNPNGKISPDLYTGDPEFSHYRKKQWSVGYQFEYKFDPVWTFRQNTRLMHLSLDQGQVFGGGLDPADPTEASLLRYVGLYQLNYSRFDVDNQALAKFRTGPLDHTVLLGFEYNRQFYRQPTANEFAMATAAAAEYVQQPGLHADGTPTLFSGGPDAFPRTDTYIDAQHVLIACTRAGPDQVAALGADARRPPGLEHHLCGERSRAAGTRVTQNDVMRSPGRVGCSIIKSRRTGLSPYVSYSTSFNPLMGVKIAGGGALPAAGPGGKADRGRPARNGKPPA